MGKKKSDAKKVAPRCPVENCKTRLEPEKRTQCGTCGVVVCKEHVYPDDHFCGKGITKGSDPPKAPSSGGTGGLTVVKKAAVKGRSEGTKEEAKEASKRLEEELLAKLAKAESSALLADLVTFGSSNARYDSSTVVQAMCSDSRAVQKAFFGPVAQGIGELAQEKGELPQLLKLLAAHLTKAAAAGNLSSTEEARAAGVASMYGALMPVAVSAAGGDAGALAHMDFAMGLCSGKSEKLSKAAAADIVKRAAAAVADKAAVCARVLALVDEALKVGEEDDAGRNGLALAVAGSAGACGPKDCAAEVVARLMPALGQPKKTAPLLAAMRMVLALTKEMGVALMPFLLPVDFVDTTVFKVYDKATAAGRGGTKKAGLGVVDRLDARGVRLTVPVLLGGLDDGAWRIKQLCLQMLGLLAKRKVGQMFRDLPLIVPAVMECVRDSKKQVGDAACDCLDMVGGMVSNPETMKLLPWLLAALKDPEQVDACLDELLDLTFVNSVDAQSLALIVPVVLRGLRDGTADVKLKASVTAGNVCSLVADVHDLRPFFASLMQELKKLLEHSRPRVREEAGKAKDALQADLSLTRRRSSRASGAAGKASASAADAMADASALGALGAKLEAGALPGKMGPVLFEHLVAACKMVLFDQLEDTDENMPRKLVLQSTDALLADGGMEGLLQPALPRRSEREAQLREVRDAVVDALFIAQGRGAAGAGGDGDGEKDYIVYIPSIILAFASRVLLKRAHLFLERGHRYALVAMNGMGKSTFCTRIAARDINGFPSDVSTYFVEHEVHETEGHLTVLGYMHTELRDLNSGKLKDGKVLKSTDAAALEEESVRKSLADVGFTEETMQAPVNSLSGGWKMRLAIARSMVYGADLLVLDEPTNHLDHAAFLWLQDYLAGLTDTTIVFVSHDYSFVDYVATDIVHIADQKLTYYPCTFSEFQKLRPEIVEALPKKENKIVGPGPGAEEGGGTGTGTGAEGGSALSAMDLLAMAKEGGDSEAAKLTEGIKPIIFPEGCKLDGISHRGKPVVTLKDVTYSYPGTDKTIFKNVNGMLNLNARVALLGENGAGKSTLLKLIVGELELDENLGHSGRLWKHRNVRVSYVAQHSMFHLESCIEQTPVQYIQKRFWEGQDKEAAKMITTQLTKDDEEMMELNGEVAEIVSRVARGKKLYYEIRRNGRSERGDNKDFRTLEDLERIGKDKPHVMKLVRLFDEKLKFAASGVDLRPVTTPEIVKHLAQFGIDQGLALRKTRWLSGGQRARVVMAAALWTMPHLIIMDEPTNYIDNETLAALTFALKAFRGGVIVISHHQQFVDSLAKELWHLRKEGDDDFGSLTIESLKDKDKAARAKATAAAAIK